MTLFSSTHLPVSYVGTLRVCRQDLPARDVEDARGLRDAERARADATAELREDGPVVDACLFCFSSDENAHDLDTYECVFRESHAGPLRASLREFRVRSDALQPRAETPTEFSTVAALAPWGRCTKRRTRFKLISATCDTTHRSRTESHHRRDESRKIQIHKDTNPRKI